MSKISQNSRRKSELNNLITALPLMSTKCFVCDELIQGQPVHLVMGRTPYSNASFPTKIGELVGDDFLVVVCMEDVLCGKCATLIHQLDKLETDLREVRRTLTGYLALKYKISHKDLFAKFDTNEAREKMNSAKLAESAKNPTKLYSCELCPFITREESQVSIHSEVCSKLPHGCTVCPKRFSTIENHARHAVTVHKLTKSCQTCGSLFVSEQALINHTKNHPCCSICNTVFLKQSEVDDHTRAEHPTTRVMNPNMKRANSVESCLEELDGEPRDLSHDTTSEIEFHTCNICSLTFLKASLFNEHMKMHKDVTLNSNQKEHITRNNTSSPRIEDNLEDLFEKLHAESDKSVKPNESKTDAGTANKVVEKQAIDNVPPNVKVQRHVHEIHLCCVCNKPYLSELTLESHVLTHFTNGSCKCSVCNNVISDQAAAIEHCRKHLQEKHPELIQDRRRRKCRVCSVTFPTRHLYLSHKDTHAAESVFTCSICDRRFTTEQLLKKHSDSYHRMDRNCRFCGKEVNNLQSLKRHEQRHGSRPKPVQCSHCPRVFRTALGLHHHSILHKGHIRYCCNLCDKVFRTNTMLERHRSSHVPVPAKEKGFECEVCDRTFTFHRSYWIHKRWHENPHRYKCNICSRVFSRSSVLAVHKRKHTGERPYKCGYCKLSFACRNSLKRHLILHTRLYPHKCEDCNKGFTTRYLFDEHRAKTHGVEGVCKLRIKPKNIKKGVRGRRSKYAVPVVPAPEVPVVSEAVSEPLSEEVLESVPEEVVCETVSEEVLETVESWQLVDANGVALDQVVGESLGTDIVLGTSSCEISDVDGLSVPPGTQIVEIVMDDSYQTVGTVTLDGTQTWYSELN